MTGTRPGRPRSGGFTLVELLVALTLLGLIFVALFGGLRFGTRTWETGNQRSEAFAEVEVMQSLLRRQLAQAVTLRTPKGDQAVFVGEGDRLGFAAPGPSQTGVGGLYLFEIFTEPSDENHRLVLRWQIHRPALEFPLDDEESKRRVLLENVEGLRFSYFGDTEKRKDVQWNDSWSDLEFLPKLVLIEVALPSGDGRYWPDLIVAPRSTSSANLP
ncbi:MAG: prepilin-type N-terminal cleavage/methylation domain-containing protein [Rhodospirillales bacterium]|nr:prepilin-type N-terminal cleavage/methylation domain-containing protein [Rhodospirillales bacterium]MDH3970149.1 prepilin-type N-terminal cleavage/methylation domain-containing protein [Rhodospirillales bacterium]